MGDELERLRSIRAEIDANYEEGRRLLERRDLLAREAMDAGLSWTAVRAALGLSKRGLQIVLSRTLPPQE